MRYSLTLFALTAFICTAASEMPPKANIFNADMRNPIIAKAVKEFETVCLPFIAHQTELTWEQDQAVFENLMVEKGYKYQGVTDKQVNVGMGDDPDWGRGFIPDGVFGNAFQNAGPIRYKRAPYGSKRGELFPRLISKPIVLYTSDQSFITLSDLPVSANLTWVKNYPGDRPAYACHLNLNANEATFDIARDIISFDPGWLKDSQVTKRDRWTQCTQQDDQNYLYEISELDEGIYMKVEIIEQDWDKILEKHYNCKPAQPYSISR